MSGNVRRGRPRAYVVIRSDFCCGKLRITARIFDYDVLLTALAERCCDSDLGTGMRSAPSKPKGNGNKIGNIISFSLSVVEHV
mgnify:CR=1 FL=1